MTLTQTLKNYFAKTSLAQVKKDFDKSKRFDKVGVSLDAYMEFVEEERKKRIPHHEAEKRMDNEEKILQQSKSK
jgi:hypothetical protein